MKQFGDLSPADFAASAVWVQCHVIDYDEPWYHETDEETFRPWRGALPVHPEDGAIFLVSALFDLAGTSLPLRGFVTPQPNGPPDFGTMQPHVFMPSGRVGAFWLGMFDEPDADFHQELLALSQPVFPVRFAALPDLCVGLAAGVLRGFYRWSDDGAVIYQPPS